MKYEPPRQSGQSGYDVSTNETGGKKVRQAFAEYFENQ